MKNLRNLMAWVMISAVLMMGTASANAGVLLGDRTTDSCTTSTDIKVVTGIILDAIIGVVIMDRGGVVIMDRGGVVIMDRCQ